MSQKKQASLVGTIDSLLSSLNGGTTKSAEAYSEPGSQGGATTHPSKAVDDSLQKGTEGSHSATNEADVKADQPLGVDKAEAGAGGSQNDKQTNIGITSKPTGEDPSAETDSAKAGKDDPGSSHPARTDNDSLDGMKYASQVDRFRAFAKQAEAKGNALTAAIAATADAAVKAASKPAAKAPAAKAAEATPAAAAAAGAAIAEDVTSDMDKQAAEAILTDALAETVAVAEDAAVRAVNYMRKCAAEAHKAQKKAQTRKKAEEGDDSSDPSKSEGEGEGGGGEESGSSEGGEGGGDAGGGSPSDEELMSALSGGGGDAGAMGGGGDIGAQDALGAMAGGGGAAPPADPTGGAAPPADPAAAGGMPGGDPMGGAGGMPGGMPGGDPMGDAGGMPPTDPMGGAAPGSGGELTEEDLAILSHILAKAGITPEALEAGATAKMAKALKEAQAKKIPVPAWTPKNAAEAAKASAMEAYVKELVRK